MPKKRTSKCTVVFAKAWHGVGYAAELRWKGHTLNAISRVSKRAPTAKQKARARAKLMRGCAELSRDYKKNLR